MVDLKGAPLAKGVNKDHPEGYGLGIQASYQPKLNTVVYSRRGGTFGFSSSWRYIESSRASVIFALNTSREMDQSLEEFDSSIMNSLPKSCLSDT